jgi:hypothetical protein
MEAKVEGNSAENTIAGVEDICSAVFLVGYLTQE